MAKEECTHGAIMSMPVVETRKNATTVVRWRKCTLCEERIETMERRSARIAEERQETHKEMGDLQAALYQREMKLRGIRRAVEVFAELMEEEGDGGEGVQA